MKGGKSGGSTIKNEIAEARQQIQKVLNSVSKISAFCDEQFLVAVIITLIFFSSLSHHLTFHKSFYLSHFLND